jgi:hypothetical protein
VCVGVARIGANRAEPSREPGRLCET